jgi:pyruvate-formate lyase-activating enzyme
MNIYHITFEPGYHVLDLHFWGCNLNCRGCYKNYEIYDLGLNGHSVDSLQTKTKAEPPHSFLSRDEIMAKIAGFDVRHAIFMGQEAAMDPELPALASAVHRSFNSYNILLTNGLRTAELGDIDEVVFSFKAFGEEVHREYTGISNRQILNNFQKIYKSGKQLQAEIAFIPGLVENEEIAALARYIAAIDDSTTFRITAYFAVPGAPWPSASPEQVIGAAELTKKYLKNIAFMTTDMKGDNWKPQRIY